MENAADLVRQHAQMVWSTVYRLVANDADAGDCFQETFATALEVGRRERVRSWEGMLKRVAISKALDLLRRRQRERKRQAGGILWETIEGPERRPDLAAESLELSEQLRAALAELPPPQGEAFCMRHLSEMSYEEIGLELGMKANAVGVMLLRTKARLASLMNNQTKQTRGEVHNGKQ